MNKMKAKSRQWRKDDKNEKQREAPGIRRRGRRNLVSDECPTGKLPQRAVWEEDEREWLSEEARPVFMRRYNTIMKSAEPEPSRIPVGLAAPGGGGTGGTGGPKGPMHRCSLG